MPETVKNAPVPSAPFVHHHAQEEKMDEYARNAELERRVEDLSFEGNTKEQMIHSKYQRAFNERYADEQAKLAKKEAKVEESLANKQRKEEQKKIKELETIRQKEAYYTRRYKEKDDKLSMSAERRVTSFNIQREEALLRNLQEEKAELRRKQLQFEEDRKREIERIQYGLEKRNVTIQADRDTRIAKLDEEERAELAKLEAEKMKAPGLTPEQASVTTWDQAKEKIIREYSEMRSNTVSEYDESRRRFEEIAKNDIAEAEQRELENLARVERLLAADREEKDERANALADRDTQRLLDKISSKKAKNNLKYRKRMDRLKEKATMITEKHEFRMKSEELKQTQIRTKRED